MNASVDSEIAVAKPLPRRTVRCRLKPFRRQSHDEHSGGTNYPADHDHAISREPLRQRADHRPQQNDQDRIDGGNPPDWRVQPELAITKFRKAVVHLEEDGVEESDKEEENEKP